VLWVALWILVSVIGVAGTIASVNSVRFERRVARDAAILHASPGSGAAVRARRSELPPPVRRYLAKAVPERSRDIRRARLQQHGLFRPSLNGSWLPLRGRQFFNADPPGFVWWGRVRLAPGVWIDARDRSVDGTGNMLVTMESTITIGDTSGPQLDQGAALRLLGEMAWIPTVLLDTRYVTWTAVDDRHAKASLTVNGRSFEGDFEFGADDLPSAFTANRYRDIGGGHSVLTPFVGRVSDFRTVDGVQVPFRVIGAWVIDGTPIDYANFEVDQIAFDWSE